MYAAIAVANPEEINLKLKSDIYMSDILSAFNYFL